MEAEIRTFTLPPEGIDRLDDPVAGILRRDASVADAVAVAADVGVLRIAEDDKSVRLDRRDELHARDRQPPRPLRPR